MFMEIEHYPIKYILQIQLDNGVIISVLPDGTADGSDGKKYKCISCEDDNGDTVINGWEATGN